MLDSYLKELEMHSKLNIKEKELRNIMQHLLSTRKKRSLGRTTSQQKTLTSRGGLEKTQEPKGLFIDYESMYLYLSCPLLQGKFLSEFRYQQKQCNFYPFKIPKKNRKRRQKNSC